MVEHYAFNCINYIIIGLKFHLLAHSGAESTLKVGVYFNISYFFANFRKWGVTKSRPIDPFFYVIYLFLNIRFGQKSVQISYFLPSTLLFFPLFHLNFFDDFFIFFAQPPIFSAPKNFFPPKIFLPPLKIFLHPKFFSSSPNFCCASLAPIFKSLQKVVSPKKWGC